MKKPSIKVTKTKAAGLSPDDEMDIGILRCGDGKLSDELETRSEKLRSINEMLTTVNDDMESNVDQLALSNNDLQNLMATIDIATVFLDRELRIERFSPAAKTLFNFIPTDIGLHLTDSNFGLDCAEIVGDAEYSLALLKPTQREVGVGKRSYIARTFPHGAADNHVAGVVLSFLDITERKRADEAIARLGADSERQRRMYETVLTNTPDFVYVFSLDHRVLYANDSLIKMWGCGPDGAIGKTFLEIGYERWHAAMHDREIDQVRETRQPIRGEVPFNGTNGRRQYDYIFVPVIGADNEVEAVAGTTRDVTERKEVERQLREGQEQMDFALVAAELGQWALNLTEHTVIRTLRHDQIFGYDVLLPEWTYEMFLEHVVPADRSAVDADFQQSVATGSPWAVECRIRRADGTVRHIWAKGLVRRDAEGQVERMLGIIGDITDRQQSVERQAFQIRLAETLRPLSAASDVQCEASRLLGEHLGANRVVYFEIRGDEYVIERSYTARVRALSGRYPLAAFGPVLLAALLDGRTVIEADATIEPNRPPSEREAFAGIQVRGHVDVPLVKGGRVVAGMTVQYADRRDWSRQEVTLIEETAERTWAALERVRAEAALHQSEERLVFVRRSSGIGFWYCDLPFDILQWDDLVKDHFHLPHDAAVTIQMFYDLIHPDDREPTRRAIERSITERTHYNADYRTVNPGTGAIKWVRAIGRTFYAADGTPTRFDGVTLDVSDQKQAEASLKESEQRFRLVADAAPVLIWLSGADKRFHWFNKPWLAFTGRSMANEVGDGWTQGIHPDDVDRFHLAYITAFVDRTPFTIEYRLRRHDGEFRWLIDNGVPRFRPDGEFDGYIGSCSDVTEYKNAETELRRADRRKDEFLATLAHELRNPLAPIRSGLQAIKMVGVDGIVEQATSMMERQLLQMTRLVDDLLDVSRLTNGKLELRTERIQLQEVIAAALETSRPVIEQQSIGLTVVLPDEPIFVDGDSIRLAQVVSNLLNNSAKYTHRDGHIRVSVTRDGETAVLAVADNGIGIPTHMLEAVFEMFTQVDRTLEKTSGGLGVGLSLVKGLIQLHGGTIEAFSAGEGRGSELVVRLPIAPSAVRESEQNDAEATRVGPTHIRRILIVDDNKDAAEALGLLLEMMGNEVLTSYDGESGIKVARVFLPSVILCDIGMPKMNGYDTARTIRAEEWGKDTVLVALTGWSQGEDRKRSLEAGFDYHLVKPVDVDALMALLAGIQTQ